MKAGRRYFSLAAKPSVACVWLFGNRQEAEKHVCCDSDKCGLEKAATHVHSVSMCQTTKRILEYCIEVRQMFIILQPKTHLLLFGNDWSMCNTIQYGDLVMGGCDVWGGGGNCVWVSCRCMVVNRQWQPWCHVPWLLLYETWWRRGGSGEWKWAVWCVWPLCVVKKNCKWPSIPIVIPILLCIGNSIQKNSVWFSKAGRLNSPNYLSETMSKPPCDDSVLMKADIIVYVCLEFVLRVQPISPIDSNW